LAAENNCNFSASGWNPTTLKIQNILVNNKNGRICPWDTDGLA
jgi:hypothetical protein